MHIDKLKRQLPGTIDAPVPNCRLRTLIRCNKGEIWQAIQADGILQIRRKASREQRNPSVTGCDSFALEGVTLIEDRDGNIVDYDRPPAIDENTNLYFTLNTSLIDYDSSPLLPPRPSDSSDPFRAVEQAFDNLTFASLAANRRFFPPDPIFFEGRKLEVAGNCVCLNTDCHYNSGEVPQILK
jgi:hypothetical protein